MLLFTVAALCAASPSVNAQATLTVSGGPHLFVQRGQNTDITLHGKNLESVTSIAIVHARGLTVTPVEAAKGAKRAAGEVMLHIDCAADAALGDREMRLLAATGVSAPLRIVVGQYPVFLEKEPNNTPEQAQDVTFPVSIAGKIETPGDIDCFRFSAVKGQKVVFDVHAARSRSQLDAVVSVYNDTGRELPVKVDQYSGDPTAIFSVPADGRYVVVIRDLQYRGGEEYSYHIDAGLIPYVQSVLPLSAQPGKVAEVKPQGVNLTGAETIPLDLTYAAEGDISVRARASGGTSNAVKIAVNDLPVFVDDKPAHTLQTAVAVSMPVDISGRIAQGGDENFVTFHVDRKQLITVNAITAGIGSPATALLTLRNSKGDAMQTADGSVGDANITRELDTGDYLVSIRDLFFAGGPRYAYRIQIHPGGSSGGGSQDYSIRFLPDALRVSRGSSTIVYADLLRKGGFAGDVTAVLEDLPPGVTCPPLVMNDKLPGASGVLVISADNNAPLGSFPIKLRASAMIGSSLVVHDATALLDGRDVEQAYLTVLDAAPVTIEPVAGLTSSRIEQLAAETDALTKKLSQPTPQLQTAQTAWEKKVSAPVQWTTLKDAKITSATGTTFSVLEDGSILAGKPSPERDTYTLVATTSLSKITAVRLEALPDPSLPRQGPGRAGGGNFVLSSFTAAIADKTKPAETTPIAFRDPVADVEQAAFPVTFTINPKLGKGWGISPTAGTEVEALFFTKSPAGTAKESILSFILDQQFGQQHTLGHFRISVTSDPRVADRSSVPGRILKLVSIPSDKRTKEQAAQVAAYYKTLDPQFADDAARLETLRTLVGNRTEIVRLEKTLATDAPEINADRAKWEKSIEAGSAWLPLEVNVARSKNGPSGATLTKQPDGSWLATGARPANDTYILNAPAPFTNITAVRIEALPDSHLPSHGPGRADDGNFVLTGFTLSVVMKDSPTTKSTTKPAARTVAEWREARASIEQKGHAAATVLKNTKDAGWAIAPAAGRPAVATFYAKEPIAAPAGSILTLMLDQQSTEALHTLGRFRIWVTSNPDPDAAGLVPAKILAILKTPSEKENKTQKAELSAYYRSIAPSLEPLRDRLAELTSETESDLSAPRAKKFQIPFLLNRTKFKGNVTVTLKGFTAKRDPVTGIATEQNPTLKVEPLEVPAGKSSGTLTVDVQRNGELASRYVVLRVEATNGDDRRVEYSQPFVLTVLEK